MIDELVGPVSGQRRREREHGDVVDAAFRQYLELLQSNREQRTGRGGIHDFQRVRLEGDDQTSPARVGRAFRQPSQDPLVAAVHAVERPDGGDGALDARREPARDGLEDRVTHHRLPRAGRGSAVVCPSP